MLTPYGRFMKKPSSLRWASCLASLLIVPLTWSQQNSNDDEGEEVFELSPFEVSTSEKDVGYYAENTLAGSRMNTRISDLAASITVVTKQQLEDTASTDINDVFRYEANTEGASTYTPGVLSMRSDGVADTIAGVTAGNSGTPQTVTTANRVRGLGSPDRTINYYLSAQAFPIDSYNIESMEINRGPNSMLFGMGSPAGIVNVSWATANLDADNTRVRARFDDRGSQRYSLSFNRPLTDEIAVYGAFLYDDQRFTRKPSYDRTRRQYGSITWQPSDRTRIDFSIENYDNDNRRPNSITPRDGVSYWRSVGSPYYDPTTLSVYSMDSGELLGGPYVMNAGSMRADDTRAYIESLPGYDESLWNTYDPEKDNYRTSYNGVSIFGEGALYNQDSALYVPGITWTNRGRPTMQIADGQVVNWFTGYPDRYLQSWNQDGTNPDSYPETSVIYADPVLDQAYNQRYSSSALPVAPEAYPGYIFPGVTDKSIYDYEDVNILQMNFGEQDALTFNLEGEQVIIDDLLHVSAGWFHQKFDVTSNYSVSQLNAATIYVDTNKFLPDGTENPYFGEPYVEDFDPDQFINEYETDQYRVMAAFTPDFTKHDGWMRWLGRHQIMALASREYDYHTFYRNRWFFTDGDEVDNGTIRWLNNPYADGWNYQNTSVRRAYYLSDPGGTAGKVTESSGRFDNSSYTGNVRTFNYGTGEWEDLSMTQEYVTTSWGTSRNERIIDSTKLGATSHFWNDRIVTTLGISYDVNKAHTTTTGEIEYDDGTVLPKMTDGEIWVDGVYQEDTIFDRYEPWTKTSGKTTTTGVVFSPFSGWSSLESKARSGSIFHEFLTGFAVFYNNSDNFNPPTQAYTDAFGTPLPKPTGETKDYGFQFSLFDQKLFARFTWFEGTNENEPTSPGSALSRLTSNIDTTLYREWAETITRINMGYDPTDKESWEAFDDAMENDAFEQNFEQQVAEIWGLDYDYYDNITNMYATRTAEAEGMEVQITYNPVRNWSIKFTGGKQETIYSNVLREFDAWYAERIDDWDSATAAAVLDPEYQQYASTFTMHNGREVDLSNFWGGYGWNGNAALDNNYGYTNVQKYYDAVVTPQYRLASDLNGQAAPGQREYRWSLITNYAFDGGPLDGFNFGGSLRWEDEAIIGYYGMDDPNTPEEAYTLSDTSRPIYDDANYYTDLWVGYTRNIMDDKVRMKLQLNVANVFEDGGLQVVGVNKDGSPHSYRIIDPRRFQLTATFDF
ncbi:MAG: TonB-dependent receptor plug [Puniceicoccaceae bacterium 5H]|nr:MAG: TonB-dependent receptor plug [Puniceicoccaceae bacterium 5H]